VNNVHNCEEDYAVRLDHLPDPLEPTMCQHYPACPSADATDRDAAHVVSSHPEQGWSLLCNGVVLFEDTGEILPDGSAIGPRRWQPRHPPSLAGVA
jgi:Family of unknown function (DUF5999)